MTFRRATMARVRFGRSKPVVPSLGRFERTQVQNGVGGGDGQHATRRSREERASDKPDGCPQPFEAHLASHGTLPPKPRQTEREASGCLLTTLEFYCRSTIRTQIASRQASELDHRALPAVATPG